jgi:CRP-like cAMP-binding protein
MEKICQYLQSIAIFSKLKVDEFETLAMKSHLTHEPVGQTILREGDIPDYLYVVKTGSVAQYFLDSNGGHFLIGGAFSNEVFPLEVVLANTRSRCTIEVTKKAELIHIPLGSLKNILTTNDAFAQHILNKIANRSVLLIEIIKRMTLTASSRLSHYLVDLMFSKCERTEDTGVTFKLDMSKKDLASSLGIAPETLSRLFLNLQSAGVITVNKSQITVHDVHSLVNLSVGKTQASEHHPNKG